MALEQIPHLLSIPDVGLDELVLWPGARRRAEVDVHDLLGLIATGKLVGQSAADVSGAPCDQVAHGAHPILAGRPMSTSNCSLMGIAEIPHNLARSTGSATSREKSC